MLLASVTSRREVWKLVHEQRGGGRTMTLGTPYPCCIGQHGRSYM